MKKEQVIFTKGDSKGNISELITWLEDARDKGATHYEMEWSNDPTWAFKWFRTYRHLSADQVKQEKIKKLEQEIKELKGL